MKRSYHLALIAVIAAGCFSPHIDIVDSLGTAGSASNNADAGSSNPSAGRTSNGGMSSGGTSGSSNVTASGGTHAGTNGVGVAGVGQAGQAGLSGVAGAAQAGAGGSAGASGAVTASGGSAGAAGASGGSGGAANSNGGAGATASGGVAGTAGHGGGAGGGAAGGTSGTGGSGATFTPLCGATTTKGSACAATDPQTCYKTCGPDAIGFKSETCITGAYVEQTTCSFPAGDYSCYKIPPTLSTSCPAALPMANAACTAPTCTPCNSGGSYLDSVGNQKTGYCVCTGGKWNCALVNQWPCPLQSGC